MRRRCRAFALIVEAVERFGAMLLLLEIRRWRERVASHGLPMAAASEVEQEEVHLYEAALPGARLKWDDRAEGQRVDDRPPGIRDRPQATFLAGLPYEPQKPPRGRLVH